MPDVEVTVSEFLRGAAEKASEPTFVEYLEHRVREFSVDELQELRRQIEGRRKGTDPAPVIPEVFQGQRKATILDITNNRLRALQLSVMQDKQRTVGYAYDVPADAMNVGLAKSADMLLGTDFEKKYDSSTRSEKRKIALLTIPLSLFAARYVAWPVLKTTATLGYKGLVKGPLKFAGWLLDMAKNLAGKPGGKWTKRLLFAGAILALGIGSTFYVHNWDWLKALIPGSLREKFDEWWDGNKEHLKEEAMELAQKGLDLTEMLLSSMDSAAFNSQKSNLLKALNGGIKKLLDMNDPATIQEFFSTNGFTEVAGGVWEKEVPGKDGATFAISFNAGAKKFDLREGVTVAPPATPPEVAPGIFAWHQEAAIAFGLGQRDIPMLSAALHDPKVLDEPVSTYLRVASKITITGIPPSRSFDTTIAETDPFVQQFGSVDIQKAVLLLSQMCKEQKGQSFFRGRLPAGTSIDDLKLQELLELNGILMSTFGRYYQAFQGSRHDINNNDDLRNGLAQTFDTTAFVRDAYTPTVANALRSLEGGVLVGHEQAFLQHCSISTVAAYKIDRISDSASVPTSTVLNAANDAAVRSGVVGLRKHILLPATQALLVTYVGECINQPPSKPDYVRPLTRARIADPVTEARSRLTDAMRELNIGDALQLTVFLEEAKFNGSLPATFVDLNRIGQILLGIKLAHILNRSSPALAQDLLDRF